MGGKEQNKKKRSLPQAGPGLKVEQTASEQVAAAPNATDKADLRVRKKPRKAQKDKAHVILAAGQEQSAPVPTQAANSPTAKRKGKKQKSKAQHKQDAQVKQKLASLSVAEQAAWLQHEYTSAGKATSLEAEALSEPHIRALPPEGSLEDRIKAAEDDWETLFCGRSCDSAPNGAPTLLFVTPSSILANQLVKHLKTFRKACRVAKLFSKHMKVGMQRDMLTHNVVHVASGNPNRLLKLADLGALDLQRLAMIVLDVGMDLKQRTIFDDPEVCGDWWQFVQKHLASRLDQHGTKLVLVDASCIAKDGQEHPEHCVISSHRSA